MKVVALTVLFWLALSLVVLAVLLRKQLRSWRWHLHRARGWLARHGIWYESHTCRRRMNELGPQDRSEGLDFWERGRWGWKWLRELNYWVHNGWPGERARQIREWGWAVYRKAGYPKSGPAWWAKRIAEAFNWYQGGDTWKWQWQPRTCSYCGGAHPDDVLKLMRQDWEVEATTKGYKRYLQPPGHRARHNAIMARMRDHEDPFGPGLPETWSPVPPVKVYVQHFNDEQIRRFNEIVTHQEPAVA